MADEQTQAAEAEAEATEDSLLDMMLDEVEKLLAVTLDAERVG